MSECFRSPLASGRGCWLKILQHKQALPLESRTPALQSKVQPCRSICCHSPNIIKPINRATVCQSPIEMINPARTRHRPRTGKGRTEPRPTSSLLMVPAGTTGTQRKREVYAHLCLMLGFCRRRRQRRLILLFHLV